MSECKECSCIKRGWYAQTLTFNVLPADMTAVAHSRQTGLRKATAPPTPAYAGHLWWTLRGPLFDDTAFPHIWEHCKFCAFPAGLF